MSYPTVHSISHSLVAKRHEPHRIEQDELALACLDHGEAHCLKHLRDVFVLLAESQVAMRLIVLAAVSSLPEAITGLLEGFRLQPERGLGDRSLDQTVIGNAAAGIRHMSITQHMGPPNR